MKPGILVYRGTTLNGAPMIIRYPKLSDTPAFLKFINTLSRERTFILAQGRKFSIGEESKWLEENIKNIKKKYRVVKPGCFIVFSI